MLGSWNGRAANDLEAMRSETDFRSNFIWAFPIGSEFSMFPHTSYNLHASENEVAHLNRL